MEIKLSEQRRHTPCRVTFSGDIEAAKAYIGRAKSQLEILREQQAIGMGNQHRKIRINPRATVHCRQVGDLSGIHIYVKPSKIIEDDISKLGFILIITTQSQKEGFAWDLFEDEVLVTYTVDDTNVVPIIKEAMLKEFFDNPAAEVTSLKTKPATMVNGKNENFIEADLEISECIFSTGTDTWITDPTMTINSPPYYADAYTTIANGPLGWGGNLENPASWLTATAISPTKFTVSGDQTRYLAASNAPRWCCCWLGATGAVATSNAVFYGGCDSSSVSNEKTATNGTIYYEDADIDLSGWPSGYCPRYLLCSGGQIIESVYDEGTDKTTVTLVGASVDSGLVSVQMNNFNMPADWGDLGATGYSRERVLPVVSIWDGAGSPFVSNEIPPDPSQPACLAGYEEIEQHYLVNPHDPTNSDFDRLPMLMGYSCGGNFATVYDYSFQHPDMAEEVYERYQAIALNMYKTAAHQDGLGHCVPATQDMIACQQMRRNTSGGFCEQYVDPYTYTITTNYRPEQITFLSAFSGDFSPNPPVTSGEILLSAGLNEFGVFLFDPFLRSSIVEGSQVFYPGTPFEETKYFWLMSNSYAQINFGSVKNEAGGAVFEYAGGCSNADAVTGTPMFTAPVIPGDTNPDQTPQEEWSCVDYDRYYDSIFQVHGYVDDLLSGMGLSIFNEINTLRVAAGKDALETNFNLFLAAQKLSKFMAQNGDETHISENGDTLEDRLDKYTDWFIYKNRALYDRYECEENIAGVVTNIGYDATIAAVIANWLSDGTASANIYSDTFLDTAVSVRTDSSGLIYICQVFGYQEHQWPGYTAFDTTALGEYMYNNFTWENIKADGFSDNQGPVGHIPKVFLGYHAYEEV